MSLFRLFEFEAETFRKRMNQEIDKLILKRLIIGFCSSPTSDISSSSQTRKLIRSDKLLRNSFFYLPGKLECLSFEHKLFFCSKTSQLLFIFDLSKHFDKRLLRDANYEDNVPIKDLPNKPTATRFLLAERKSRKCHSHQQNKWEGK